MPLDRGWTALLAALLPAAEALAQPATADASQASLHGELSLTAGGRPLRRGELQHVIVYFRPANAPEAAPLAEERVMDQVRKQFVPRVLAITPGSRVRFANSDPILHNAFSPSAPNDFDVGLYGRGDGVAVQFDHVGHVRVFCNVHRTMVGHILVLDTPHFTNVDERGRFRLEQLPAGPGELFAWHERANLFRQPLELQAGSSTAVNIRLELSARRVEQHLNKFGQPYRSSVDEYPP